MENIILKIVLALLTVSSVACLIFILTKLKLNIYIKSILIILVFMNSIDLGISFLLQFVENYWRCYLSRLIGAHMVGSFPMSGMISVLRFRMTKLASKAKFIKEKHAILSIVFGSVLFYSYSVGLALTNQVNQ